MSETRIMYRKEKLKGELRTTKVLHPKIYFSNWLDGESLDTAWACRVLRGAGLIVKFQNKKYSFLPPHIKIFIF